MDLSVMKTKTVRQWRNLQQWEKEAVPFMYMPEMDIRMVVFILERIFLFIMF